MLGFEHPGEFDRGHARRPWGSISGECGIETVVAYCHGQVLEHPGTPWAEIWSAMALDCMAAFYALDAPLDEMLDGE